MGALSTKKAKLDFNFGSDDFWFTQKENKVYAIALARLGEEYSVKSLLTNQLIRFEYWDRSYT